MPVVPTANNRASKANFAGNFTVYAFVCCLVASSGGLLFGYDLGEHPRSPIATPAVWHPSSKPPAPICTRNGNFVHGYFDIHTRI